MMSVSSDGWYVFGNHQVRFEPPDIVHMRPGGDISLTESLELIKFWGNLTKPEKGFFSLVDMAKAGRQDPSVAKRPESLEYLRMQRAQVFYNATFYHRTAIGIFIRLSKLLKNATPANATVFTTEDEARAWIAETRAQDPSQ